MTSKSWSVPTIRTINETKYIVAFHYFCQTSAGHQVLEFKHSFSEELCEKTFGTSDYNRAFQECIDPMQDHVIDCLYHSSDTCQVCQDAPATRVLVSTKYLLDASQPLIKNFTSVVCQSETCEITASRAMKAAAERLDARLESLERSLWPEIVYPTLRLPIEDDCLDGSPVSPEDNDDSVQTIKSVREDAAVQDHDDGSVIIKASLNTTDVSDNVETPMIDQSVVQAIIQNLRDSNKSEGPAAMSLDKKQEVFLLQSPPSIRGEGPTRPLSYTKASSILMDEKPVRSLASPRSSNVPRITIQQDTSDLQESYSNPNSPSIVDSNVVDEAVSRLAADDDANPTNHLNTRIHSTIVPCANCSRAIGSTGQLAAATPSTETIHHAIVAARSNTRKTARSVDLVEYRDATMHLLSIESERRNFLDVSSVSSSGASAPQSKDNKTTARERARQFRTAAKKTLTCVAMRKIKSLEVLQSRTNQRSSCSPT